jgi:hypothetical protein
VKKSLKNSLYSSNFGVGRNSCSDMAVAAFLAWDFLGG